MATAKPLTNYEVALRAEQKRCERNFHWYDHNSRADLQAASRVRNLGRHAEHRMGEVFWTHPDLGNICFPRRIDAARAALNTQPA